MKMMISEMIPVGKSNAISKYVLMENHGLTERELRDAIRRERLQGALILSNRQTGGYYLPASRSEIREFFVSNRRQALSMLRMLKTAKQNLDMPEGQLALDGKEKT